MLESAFLLQIIDGLVQITCVLIIASGVAFLIDQTYCYFYSDESQEIKTVRRIFIGYDLVIVALMSFATFVRFYKIDTFAILPSLGWLVLHMALLGAIVYSYKEIYKINRKK